MDLKGIVFDKDGTLFDFNATWGAWTAGLIASEAQGLDRDAALRRALNAAATYVSGETPY